MRIIRRTGGVSLGTSPGAFGTAVVGMPPGQLLKRVEAQVLSSGPMYFAFGILLDPGNANTTMWLGYGVSRMGSDSNGLARVPDPVVWEGEVSTTGPSSGSTNLIYGLMNLNGNDSIYQVTYEVDDGR